MTIEQKINISVPHYDNGPEGMPRVERMTDSTIDWVVNGVDTDCMLGPGEAPYRKLRNVAHAVAEEVLARLPAWPATIASRASPVAQEAVSAFEDRYKRDSNDPSCAEELRLWCEAWQAGRASVAVPDAQPVGNSLDELNAMLKTHVDRLVAADCDKSAQPVGEAVAWAVEANIGGGLRCLTKVSTVEVEIDKWVNAHQAEYSGAQRAKVALYRSAPPGARTTLNPMGDDAGAQWYFNCDEHYIDVTKDEEGKYSVYFRDRATDGEAWLDQADMTPPVAQDQDAARWRMHLSLMVKRGHSTRSIGETIDAVDSAIQAEVKP